LHHFFYLLPANEFHGHIRPALTASWQQHSFAPCRELCTEILPRANAFREKAASADEQPLLSEVARGIAFDRTLWKLLVGEILMYSAAETPFLEFVCAALCRLHGEAAPESTQRAEFTPILQVHFGAQDLRFGGGFYRPEHAGFNDTPDVPRLASFLEEIDPGAWDPALLEGLPGCESAEDREEELDLVRDWFPSLRAVYRGAAERRQIIVCESL
jgi:hypothetical protein